jgi:hypothetical protein
MIPISTEDERGLLMQMEGLHPELAAMRKQNAKDEIAKMQQ